MDTVTGTAGADAFTATYDGTTAGSFGVSDTIIGGAGVDVLNITASDDAIATLTAAAVSGVETINIRNVDGNATAEVLTVNASNFTGATALNADRATDSITFTNLATGAAIGVIGNGTVVGGAVVASYATGTDAVTLNISGGTKMTAGVTDAGTATAATINSTGAANTIGTVDLANATLTAVTVNASSNLKGDFLSQATNQVGAAGSVTIAGSAASVEFTAALDDTITTLNASGMTVGGLTATLGTGVTKFTGGAGKDVITTAATTTAAAVIDGGAGSEDKLVLAATNDVTTTAIGAQYVGFETLGVNNTQDVSLVAGITALELGAMTSKTVSKISAAQAAAITVAGTQTTAVTLTLADATGSSDTVSLALKSATATTNVNVAGLSVAGVETLNIAATTGTAATSSTVDFAAGGADKLTAINITGTADVALVGTNTSKAVTVNSATSGITTISGNFVNASSITTGAAKDSITLGTGFGSYNAGAGDDAINATAAQLNTGADYNVINGGDGTDTLNITGAAALTLVDNNLSKISGVEKIVVATTVDNNQTITTGGFIDAAFKTSGFDLTTTTAKGFVTIDMTSFTGNAKLNVTTVGTAGAATEGQINIQTGTGNDDVTVSAAAAGGDGTVKTFAGNDKITTASAEAFTINAGAGNDTIVLGSTGVETLVFADTAALNGVDTITGFELTDIINWVKGGAETIVTGALTTTADVMYALGGQTAGKADTAEAVAAAVTAAGTWTAAAATAWITISDDNSTAIYAWTDVVGTAGVQATEITLVGTIATAMTSAQIQTATTI